MLCAKPMSQEWLGVRGSRKTRSRLGGPLWSGDNEWETVCQKEGTPSCNMSHVQPGCGLGGMETLRLASCSQRRLQGSRSRSGPAAQCAAFRRTSSIHCLPVVLVTQLPAPRSLTHMRVRPVQRSPALGVTSGSTVHSPLPLSPHQALLEPGRELWVSLEGRERGDRAEALQP